MVLVMALPDRRTLKRPLQARSVASYERLVAAARAILEEKSFDEATVAEIAGRAGLTVGAFYARFADKEALLSHLEALLYEEFRAVVDRVSALADEPDAAPARLVRELMGAIVELYRANRAVGRALVLRSRTDAALRERLRALNRENIARVVAAIEASGTIRHPDPRAALEFALLAQRSLLREAIFFGEGFAHGRAWSDDDLAAETSRLVLRYLGLDEEEAAP